jgi:hypothetical protein
MFRRKSLSWRRVFNKPNNDPAIPERDGIVREPYLAVGLLRAFRMIQSKAG